ncbi:MAG: hypothetical protein Q4A16_10025 [Lautropia sp.]|nr:hypothetical protein [Lautropia sp.]
MALTDLLGACWTEMIHDERIHDVLKASTSTLRAYGPPRTEDR